VGPTYAGLPGNSFGKGETSSSLSPGSGSMGRLFCPSTTDRVVVFLGQCLYSAHLYIKNMRTHDAWAGVYLIEARSRVCVFDLILCHNRL
jgi:hypothetical protein